MQRLRFLLLTVPMVLLACGGSDAGSAFDEPGAQDTGSTAEDSGSATDTRTGSETTTEDDAEPPPVDSGVVVEDGTAPVDTGVVEDTAKPPTDSGTCTEPGGKVFGGHCYFPTEARFFYTARDLCVARKAHLATITSSEEQAFVATIATGDRWIGLSRDATSPTSSFRWINAEPVGYTNWQPGEPNGSGSCARLRGDGQWADISCNSNLVAICERE